MPALDRIKDGLVEALGWPRYLGRKQETYQPK